MITHFSEAKVENPIQEIWRHLRFFLDKTFVIGTIKRLHNIQENIHISNIGKQAEQLGFCIQQAEEYFQAANTVGLSTKPLLLYYGAVALTRALTLLKLNGDHSIDGLRKQNKHKHHGLELLGDLEYKLKPGENWPVFFERIKCRCFVNKDSLAWGHFALVCQSLVPSAFFYTARKRERGKSIYLEKEIVMDSAERIQIQELIGKEINLLELLVELPELYTTLNKFSIRPALCRGNLQAEIVQTVNEGKLEKENHCYDFFINAIYDNVKHNLIQAYLKKGMNLVEDWGPHIHMRIEFEISGDQFQTINAPDIIDDLVGTKYFLLNPGRYIQEEIKYLIILFCLGMLSRYYPDVWIRTLNSNVLVREIIDSLLSLIHRKLPNLILDQLTGVKHYIHS